jgi:hypothetical protein
MLLVTLLAACSCPEDTVSAPGGECLEPAEHAETQEEALAMLPDCEPLSPSDRLDITAGCADGVCAGSSFTENNANFGETGDCEHGLWEDDYLYCNWGEDVYAFYDDADNDGVPDGDDTSLGVYIHDSWDGSDADGLGIGVSFRCFMDALGEPSDIDYYTDNRGYVYVTDMDWGELGLYVNGHYSDFDGTAWHISLFGAD